MKAFWIDTDYDRGRASDGKSRYGAYIRRNISGFAECWDGTWDDALPIRFAQQAWRVATGPIMAPGYVRYHRRIMSARLEHNYWDGSLTGCVDLITPWPKVLRQSSDWMKQTDRGWWHDWPTAFSDYYGEPSEEDLSKRPYLLSSTALRFTVPNGLLPQPPSTEPAGDVLTALASQSVAVLVTGLNRIVGPVIQAFEAS